MFRALLHLNGYTCNFDFDEEYFYINEQLKESGLPMREYLTKVNKSSYKETIGTRVKFNLNSKNYYLFSPATFVDFYFTEVSVKKNYTSSKIKAVFDYDQNNCTKDIRGYYVNSSDERTIDKCHEDCLECKMKWTINSTKCTKCEQSQPFVREFPPQTYGQPIN